MFGEITDPVGLRYRAREDAGTALSTPSPESTDGIEGLLPPEDDASDRVTLSDHTIHRRSLMQGVQSDDDDARALAINAVNDLSQRLGDLQTGERTIELSETGLFPPLEDQGIPEAVSINFSQRLMADMQWTALFDVQDRRGQPTPLFKITDVYSAASFQQYERGEEIEIGHVEGGQAKYEANLYGGGLGWNRLWREWQTLWAEQDGVAAMNARYVQKQAERAYSVLFASGTQTTSYVDFDNSSNTSAANDAATINAAMTDILEDLYTGSSPQTGEQTDEQIANPRFYLVIPQFDDELWLRAQRALRARISVEGGNSQLNDVEVRFPVEVIQMPYTNILPKGNWKLVLPGRKNVAAIFRDLTMYDKEDVQKMGVEEATVGQGAYRMVRGDSNQVRDMATS